MRGEELLGGPEAAKVISDDAEGHKRVWDELGPSYHQQSASPQRLHCPAATIGHLGACAEICHCKRHVLTINPTCKQKEKQMHLPDPAQQCTGVLKALQASARNGLEGGFGAGWCHRKQGRRLDYRGVSKESAAGVTLDACLWMWRPLSVVSSVVPRARTPGLGDREGAGPQHNTTQPLPPP